MENCIVEVFSRIQTPSPDAGLVLFSDGKMYIGEEQAKVYMALLGEYALRHQVYALSGLVWSEGSICLCLFSPEGRMIARQPVLHRPLMAQQESAVGRSVFVVQTPLGAIALLPEDDLCVPESARSAALKGADILLALQRRNSASLPGLPPHLLAWEAAQRNNVYVVHVGDGCTAACPAPLTRRGDGYLAQNARTDVVRFGFNLRRLREVRESFPLLERMNRPALCTCLDNNGLSSAPAALLSTDHENDLSDTVKT